MSAPLPSKSIPAEAAKQARWEVQRRVSKLSIRKTDDGILGMLWNLALRRPAEFPTFAFSRFRSEVKRQARRKPLSAPDMAIIKLRAELLGSPIDSRHSKPLTGADVDDVAYAAIDKAERGHDVVFDAAETDEVLDAAWKQFGEFYGSRAVGRAAQLEAADGFVPEGGKALSRRLREIEAGLVRAMREHPRRR